MAFNREELTVLNTLLALTQARIELETKWGNQVDLNNALHADNEKLRREPDPATESIMFKKYWRDRGFDVADVTNQEGVVLGYNLKKWCPVTREVKP